MLFRYRQHARPGLCSGITFAISLLAAVLTTIVFLVDVIFVSVVRHMLNDGTDGRVKATWGVGVSNISKSKRGAKVITDHLQTWLVLAASALLWKACVGAYCDTFAYGGRRK